MAVKGVRETKKALAVIEKQLAANVVEAVNVNSRLLETYARSFMQGGTSSTRLRKRSGRLQASTKAIPAKVVDGVVKGGIQFGTRYAGIHIARPGQEGGSTTIRSRKPGGFLTIPIGPDKDLAEKMGLAGEKLGSTMTKAGVSRGSALSGKYRETFIMKSKTGRLIIWGKTGTVKVAGGVSKLVPLFLLKKSVKVPFRINSSSLIRWVKPKLEKDIDKLFLNVGKPI
jgi:hypothetical protein